MVKFPFKGLHSFLILLQPIYVLVLTKSLSYASTVLYGVPGLHPQMCKIVHQVLFVAQVLLPYLKDPLLHQFHSFGVVLTF